MKNQLVTGKLVSLRVLEERDIDGPYSMWLNDPEVLSIQFTRQVSVGKDDLRKYIQEAKRSSSMQVLRS